MRCHYLILYISIILSRVCVDEDIERAEAVEEREERDAGRDLPDHVPDLAFYLLLVLNGAIHHLPFPIHLILDLELPPFQGLLSLHAVQDNHQLLYLPQLQPVFDLSENIVEECVHLGVS